MAHLAQHGQRAVGIVAVIPKLIGRECGNQNAYRRPAELVHDGRTVSDSRYRPAAIFVSFRGKRAAGRALHQKIDRTTYGLAKAPPIRLTVGARFQSGQEAMEKIHERGFEKNCNRNLDRGMHGAAIIQVV